MLYSSVRSEIKIRGASLCLSPSRITVVSAASLEELGTVRSYGKEAGAAKAASGLRKKQWPLLEKDEGQSKATVVILTS